MLPAMDLDECVRAAAAGDLDAQGALMARYVDLARRTARRLVDDQATADDVVQDAFVEAFRTLHQLRTVEAFPAWLRLIVRKHADRHRRLMRRLVLLDAIGDVPTSTVDDRLEDDEVMAVVRRAVATLADADRRLIELRYLAEWSTEDLA